MVWAVFTDLEALEILDAAAEMAAAALAARSRRVDEDNVIKRSVDMSRIKLAGLRQQFHQPALADWSELVEADQLRFLELIELMVSHDDEKTRDALFQSIRVLILRPGSKPSKDWGKSPWADEDLPTPTLERDPKTPKNPKPYVRGVRLKARSKRSSSDAT